MKKVDVQVWPQALEWRSTPEVDELMVRFHGSREHLRALLDILHDGEKTKYLLQHIEHIDAKVICPVCTANAMGEPPA